MVKDPARKIRKVMQRHLPPDMVLDASVEHLIYMNYIMFIERLAEESNKAAQTNKKNKITIDEIMEVVENVMQEFRG
ncbi:hypothetical protein BDB00DRAFT_794337 [Zychaea mexicana]|uniref:uncharacterized protein n=1 Tax=Zychaea mexicana TaxID=64656 RepID=UPI0022FDF194|nr:uncharacterized protein BDB00DRAFT_794337 [Zychaea mexicana]KAI9499521.1 hypothetical protein BDB00DRAFT_794337 [Zychaea mexicana]